MVLGFLTVGPGEMAIIAVIVLVLFGPERLPEIGKQIGMAYRELNRLRGDVHRALDIEEYTRFELPDYSAPLSQTYTYTPQNFEESESEMTGFHDSHPMHDSHFAMNAAPPGPPALASLRSGSAGTIEQVNAANGIVTDSVKESENHAE